MASAGEGGGPRETHELIDTTDVASALERAERVIAQLSPTPLEPRPHEEKVRGGPVCTCLAHRALD
jgi:hypothetical protein